MRKIHAAYAAGLAHIARLNMEAALIYARDDQMAAARWYGSDATAAACYALRVHIRSLILVIASKRRMERARRQT